jgi:hypothetical protein
MSNPRHDNLSDRFAKTGVAAMALTEAHVPSDPADQHDPRRMCEECGAAMKPVGKLPAVSMHAAIQVFRCFKCDNVASEPA